MERRIVPVASEQGLDTVRELFREYWDSFGFTPCFQNFAAELDGLPGYYAQPRGRLAIAWVDGEAAGCVALRPVDESRAEAKRLYVRPQFRGLALGRELLEWVIVEARAAGYKELLGDTMPVMERALSMYDRMGFERVAPYLTQPTDGAICIRLQL